MQIQIRKQIACGFMLLRTQNSADDWYFEIIVHCKKMNRYRYLGHIFFGWGGSGDLV
jgi:predicted Zn-dependent protease